jgi:hypothetical protein
MLAGKKDNYKGDLHRLSRSLMSLGEALGGVVWWYSWDARDLHVAQGRLNPGPILGARSLRSFWTAARGAGPQSETSASVYVDSLCKKNLENFR